MELMQEKSSTLNRSLSTPDISFNEPVYRRIYMEEFYYRDDGRASRKVRCEQLLGQRELGYGCQPFGQMQKFASENSLCLDGGRVDLNDSPMDVDVDNETLVVDDLEEAAPAASTPNVLSQCKVRYRGRVPVLIKEIEEIEETEAVGPRRGRVALVAGAICALVALLWLVPYYDKAKYDRKIRLDDIRMELERNVINQREQIAAIVDFLDKVDLNLLATPKNFLALIGTTGVGKSLCGNLIKKNFKASQIFDVDKNHLRIPEYSFHRNVPYLLVLDNLGVEDVAVAKALLDSLPRGPTLYVVAIFNTQDMLGGARAEAVFRDPSSVSKYFDATEYRVHPVVFNGISRDVVRAHVKDARALSGVIRDHDFDTFGFKGFRAKVNLLADPSLRFIFN